MTENRDIGHGHVVEPGPDQGALDREATALTAEVAFLEALVEEARHATFVIDATGTFTYASAATERMFGYDPVEAIRAGVNMVDFIDSDELAHAMDVMAWKLSDPRQSRHPLELHIDVKGRRRLLQVDGWIGGPTVVEHDDLAAAVDGIAIVVWDVTRREIVEQALDSVMREAPIESTLSTLGALVTDEIRDGALAVTFDPIPGGFASCMTTDLPHVLASMLTRCGPAGAGAAPWEAAVGSRSLNVQTGEDLEPSLRAVAAEHGYHGCWSVPLVRTGGELLGVLSLFTLDDVEPSLGETANLLETAEVIAFALDRRDKDAWLAHAATHDELTALPNRWYFDEQLDRTTGEGPGGGPVAVLYIDLDGFKQVNDRFGHSVGDRVLQAAATRIRDVVGERGVLARIGGDEFAVLWRGADDRDELGALAEQIILAASEPVVVGDVVARVGASIGVAVDAGGADMRGDLLARADDALYRAKASGRQRWELAD